MPNVWIINLKDNHTSTKKYDMTKQKADWCFITTCIGIGWIVNDLIHDWNSLRAETEIQSDEEAACKRAFKYFDDMKPGDLVWARKYDGIYYIFEIKSDKPKQADSTAKAYDIGCYHECTKYKLVGDYKRLAAEGINYKRLISRSTIRPVNANDLRDITFDLWKKLP